MRFCDVLFGVYGESGAKNMFLARAFLFRVIRAAWPTCPLAGETEGHAEGTCFFVLTMTQ